MKEADGTIEGAFGDLDLKVTNLSFTIESPGAALKSPRFGLCLSPVQAELLIWHKNISKLPEGLVCRQDEKHPFLPSALQSLERMQLRQKAAKSF